MSAKISRRRLLHDLGAVAALGAAAPLSAGGGSAPIAPKTTAPGAAPRVLALVGDRYHNPDYIRVALGRLFRDLGLPVDFTINYDQLSGRLLEPYRLLVVLRDGMIWPDGYLEPNDYEYSHELENLKGWPKEKSVGWITEEQGRAVKDFVAAGNALYALHNSSHISLYSREYREVMGGAYIDHPPLRPFKVRVVNHDHPITRGVSDFIVNDEQHYVTYDKDSKDIILRSENLDGLVDGNLGTQAIGGWAYDFGKGRVAFTAPGHTLHALWNPEYVKIQKNAVHWLLKMDAA